MAPKKDSKKMSLNEFMNDDKYGSTSWADEMEDMPTAPSSGKLSKPASALAQVPHLKG
ncbi:hypothetical protein TWF696_000815 [Orbilia brochopaga]|uniref:Uncharacterized protein n=1 Tax=Orbilia brochopaga TaxID=3140254 RepID=A0AAV9VCG1_9PEZI